MNTLLQLHIHRIATELFTRLRDSLAYKEKWDVYVLRYFSIIFCMFTYFVNEVYFFPCFNSFTPQKTLVVDKLS